MSFFRDLKIAVRSLWRVRALWITVALTLALGIGANAALFSVIRAVLLRPLANRDEDRLLYVRQSAPGLGAENTAFSVPEIDDLGKGLKTITELGTFSQIGFTIVGLGTPREIPAGVVEGHRRGAHERPRRGAERARHQLPARLGDLGTAHARASSLLRAGNAAAPRRRQA